MPRKTEVRRTGSFALNRVTMLLYYSRSLCPTQLMGNAATEVAQQSLVPEYWFEQTIQCRGINVLQVRLLWKAGVMLWCVSWTLWETEQTDTESLKETYEVFSFPPCWAGPKLAPRWCLIALVTYNIHKIPHHLTSVLEGSSVFFLLHKTNLFCYKSGQLLVLQMSTSKANHHYSLYSLFHTCLICHVPSLLSVLFHSSSLCNFCILLTFSKPLILFSGIKFILAHNL